MKNDFYVLNGVAHIQIYSKTYGDFNIMIDEEDLPKVKSHTWHINKQGDYFYARSTSLVLMHTVYHGRFSVVAYRSHK